MIYRLNEGTSCATARNARSHITAGLIVRHRPRISPLAMILKLLQFHTLKDPRRPSLSQQKSPSQEFYTCRGGSRSEEHIVQMESPFQKRDAYAVAGPMGKYVKVKVPRGFGGSSVSPLFSKQAVKSRTEQSMKPAYLYDVAQPRLETRQPSKREFGPRCGPCQIQALFQCFGSWHLHFEALLLEEAALRMSDSGTDRIA